MGGGGQLCWSSRGCGCLGTRVLQLLPLLGRSIRLRARQLICRAKNCGVSSYISRAVRAFACCNAAALANAALTSVAPSANAGPAPAPFSTATRCNAAALANAACTSAALSATARSAIARFSTLEDMARSVTCCGVSFCMAPGFFPARDFWRFFLLCDRIVRRVRKGGPGDPPEGGERATEQADAGPVPR